MPAAVLRPRLMRRGAHHIGWGLRSWITTGVGPEEAVPRSSARLLRKVAMRHGGTPAIEGAAEGTMGAVSEADGASGAVGRGAALAEERKSIGFARWLPAGSCGPARRRFWPAAGSGGSRHTVNGGGPQASCGLLPTTPLQNCRRSRGGHNCAFRTHGRVGEAALRGGGVSCLDVRGRGLADLTVKVFEGPSK